METTPLIPDHNHWEYAKKHLKLRIYPKSIRDKYPNRTYLDSLLYKIDFEDTVTMVVLEYQGNFALLQKEQTRTWEKNLHQIYDVAQANTNQENFTVEKAVLGDHSQIYVIYQNHFAPSFLLDLPRNAPDCIGKFGSLVGIPSQNTAIIAPINSQEVLDKSYVLGGLIEEFFEKPCSPLSQMLYWSFENNFYSLPVRVLSEGETCLLIPPKLTIMLDQA